MQTITVSKKEFSKFTQKAPVLKVYIRGAYNGDQETLRQEFNAHIKANKNDYTLSLFNKQNRSRALFSISGGMLTALVGMIAAPAVFPATIGAFCLYALCSATGAMLGEGYHKNKDQKKLAKLDLHTFVADQILAKEANDAHELKPISQMQRAPEFIRENYRDYKL